MVYRLLRNILKARGTYVLLLFLFMSIFIASAYRASDILFTSGKDRLVATSHEGFTSLNSSTEVDSSTTSTDLDTTLETTDQTSKEPIDEATTTTTTTTEETKTDYVDEEISVLNEEEYYTDESGNTIHLEQPTDDVVEEGDILVFEEARSTSSDSTSETALVLTEQVVETIEYVDKNELLEREPLWYETETEEKIALDERVERTLDEFEGEVGGELEEDAIVWQVREENVNGRSGGTAFDDLLRFDRFDEIEIHHSDTDFEFRYEEENESFNVAIEILTNEVLSETYLFEKRLDDLLNEDSDEDGVTDYDEIVIYKTNPFEQSTTGGSLSDSDKILKGINPVTNRPIVFEDPRVALEPIVLTYVVEELNVKVGTSTEEVDTKIEIKGRGLPNSFITIYIFSTPIVVTVKTDGDGIWSYELDKELENGEHEIYVATVDNSGKIIAKSEPIPFIKTANAAELGASFSTSEDSSGFLRNNFVAIIVLISIVGVLIMIVFVGSDLRRARIHKKELGDTSR